METLFFTQLDLTGVDERFGLEQVFDLKSLADWLSQAPELSDYQIQSAHYLRELLRLNVLGWNEQELSLHFLGPIFSLIEISSKKYNLFAERQITGQVGDCILTGRPDGMVASGYREPKIPFFAFQRSVDTEYKKEKDPNGDPAAQALGAMLVGQALNKGHDHPIYGCYVIGQNWYFMVLDGTQYAVSPAQSALTDEIFDILRALKSLKSTVERLVG